MFDVINIALVLAFAFIGFYRGFVREIAGLIIFIGSVILALHFAIPLDYVVSKSLPFPLLSTVISHVIVFATSMSVAKLFFLKTIVQHMRFISTGFDSMLGALFGGVKGLMASVLLFSCLYVSGAGILLGVNETWFYKLDHFLYKKVAIFVTSSEIATLGRVKHVQNAEEDDQKEIILNEKTEDASDVSIKEISKNIDAVISAMRGKTILNSQDDQMLSEMLSGLPNEQIDLIFDACCKNIQQVKEMLNFNENELSVYIADLVINQYKNNNNILDDMKVALAKKVEHYLSLIYAKESKNEDKQTEKESPTVKVSTDSSAAPIPVKNPHKHGTKHIALVNAEHQKAVENIKPEVGNKATKTPIENTAIKSKQVEKKITKGKLLPVTAAKSKALPVPKHRYIAEETQEPAVEAEQKSTTATNVNKNLSKTVKKNLTPSELVKEAIDNEDQDVSKLMEESIKKSKQ